MSEQKNPTFNIQRIYIKDFSFESPNSPVIFKQPWEPQVNLDMNTRAVALDDNAYEVTLMLTVTAKIKEDVAFIAEIKQAGIFTIADFPQDAINQMLAAYAPNILFPYARTTIDNMIVQGSFPAIMLAPINFDGLYQQRLADEKAAAEKAEENQGEGKEESQEEIQH